MALLETLPIGAGTAQWGLWSTTVRLVVTDPGALPVARRAVDDVTRQVEAACSRFRPDSEIARLPAGVPTRVSPLLAELVEAALLAAERTGGDVDPTLGAAMNAAGYDRDVVLIDGALIGDGPIRFATQPTRRPVTLDDDVLTVPAGVRLDLGATAKAWAADRCAAQVAAACGTGVLVSLGGDIATAGPAPDGWKVLVGDLADDPAAHITLDQGGALATSSTVSRTWAPGVHHILDPRSGTPATPVWRTVSVAAGSCVEANTLTTAAVVRGLDALPWLRSLGVPARLVGATFKIVTLGGWPGDE